MARNNNPESPPKRSSFLRVLKTVLAAALGVQSQKNLEYDGEQNSLSHYIVAGVLLVLTFALTLAGIVFLVVHFTG